MSAWFAKAYYGELRCRSRPPASSCFVAVAAGIEVLLAHPGGPLWARKDYGAWTLPKGQFTDGELPLDAAKREFEEEMGSAPSGEFQSLGTLKQPSGKVDSRVGRANRISTPPRVKSNLFSMEWPPKSGQMRGVS